MFRNIEHIVEDNNMVAEGLVSWLNAVWGILGCRTYFYTANYETHKQFLLQTLRSEMLEPKPYFIHIPNISTEDCMNILYHYRAAGKIVMSADSQIAQDLLAWEQTERKIEMPSVRALMNLVAGFERYPFSPNFVEGE